MMMSHVSNQSTNINEEVDFQSSSQFSHSAEEPEYDDSSVDDISSSENEISSFCDNDVDEDSQHSVCSVLSNRPSEIAALVTNQLSALAIIEDSSSDSDSNDDNILEVGFNLYGRSSDLEDPPQDSIMILPDTTSPDIAAESAPIHVVEAKLLHMMTKYSVPLHVYPKLMEWAKEVACTPNYDFQKPSTFASTMKKLTSHHSMSHNVANVVVVEVDDYPETKVRVFPFLQNIRKLLKNPKLMEGSVWNADPNSSVYGEINTGSWWASAEKNMVKRMEHYGVGPQEKHKLCPLLFFIDGTHCDRNGRLQAEPVLCSIVNRQKNLSSTVRFPRTIRKHINARRHCLVDELRNLTNSNLVMGSLLRRLPT